MKIQNFRISKIVVSFYHQLELEETSANRFDEEKTTNWSCSVLFSVLCCRFRSVEGEFAGQW